MRAFYLFFTFFTFVTTTVSAQQLGKMSIESFVNDPFDLSARSEQYQRSDDNGDLYSIIKVKSTQIGDDLESYRFDFGMMNSFTVHHPETEELWVYVQKGAKTVTITRKEYESIQKYDMGITIDAGCTYLMWLSSAIRMANTQIVMFNIKPAKAKATIKVKSDRQDAVELLGTTDGMGTLAKNLPLGTYVYWVTAENYHPIEGRFTLAKQNENHIETLTLRGNYGTITLTVDSDADIYVDGVNKGFRSWTGELKAGEHQVECHKINHYSSPQTIVVKENEIRTITLTPPTPISEHSVTFCPDANHPHQIDMGDGIKWACCNVGAKKPTDYGNYYAWGETESKDDYAIDRYKWWEIKGRNRDNEIKKYSNDSDGKTQLESQDDAAYVNWGETWRMPTSKEMIDLSLNCEWTWSTVDGVSGMIVTADNGNSIFLPAAGYYATLPGHKLSKVYNDVWTGSYWTSDLDSNSSFAINYIFLKNSNYKYIHLRHEGLSIRPVTK